MNRRQFLRGAGGATVAIPLLGSIQPARANPLIAPKRFLMYGTHHGGIWNENMWPTDTMLTELHDIGHTIRRGDLSAQIVGNNQVLSPVLTAPSDVLTPSILQQMNLIRGLDIPFYLSHHTGGFLGNFARNDQEGEDGLNLGHQPTIDQLMAWSNGFYADTAGMVKRSIHVDTPLSFGWANPANPGGQVDPMPVDWSSQALFGELFGTGQSNQDDEPPRLVVDKVLASYLNLRNGAFGPARRLSSGDKDRLDAHIERLYEVERKLNAVVSCTDLVPPTGDTNQHPGQWAGAQNMDDVIEYYHLWNEVIALAMICGSSRIATIWAGHIFEPYAGDWHQEVAHEAWTSQTAEDRIVRANQRFFENVFCDMLQRLDVPDCDGQTVLHNALVFWSQESGPSTHDNYSTPVISVGSASGALTTGQYMDYRNRDDLSLSGNDNPVQLDQRPGLLYAQWLATCLRVSDVPDGEWMTAGNPGYGVWQASSPQSYPTYVRDMANDALPFLTSGA